jgi:Arc/MetJ-type ribon-helix-helix transcriptional regulator
MHRILHLPPDAYDFVETRIQGGRYENSGELMQAAFRALQREERGLETERTAGSVAEEDAFRKLWEADPRLPVDRRKLPRLD